MHQFLLHDGLQQVIHAVELEGLQRIFVVSGRKDDGAFYLRLLKGREYRALRDPFPSK
jgi:hypothetical protein